jgi:hypothetical protein
MSQPHAAAPMGDDNPQAIRGTGIEVVKKSN